MEIQLNNDKILVNEKTKKQRINKPLCRNFFLNNCFDKIGITQLIDAVLGKRVKYLGYNYGEIFRNLINVFLSGGDRTFK